MRFYLISLVMLGFFSIPANAQDGEWEPWFDFGPSEATAIGPVHLVHLHTGKVIAVDSMPPNVQPYPGSGRIYLWTPPPPNSPGNPGTFESVLNTHNAQFCTGHSALADGRVLFAGSAWSYEDEDDPDFPSVPYADLFDPTINPNVVSPWNFPLPPHDMNRGRWYPTCTTLPDGKVLVCSGTVGRGNDDINWIDIPELFDPAAPYQVWPRLFSAEKRLPRYPAMFVLPDGNLFFAGPEDGSMVLNAAPLWTWTNVILPQPQWGGNQAPGVYGSVVMYEPGKIMKCGGRDPEATRATWTIDFTNAFAPPAWLAAEDMKKPRMNHNLTVLPDGKVLAVGGNERNYVDPIPPPPPPFHHNPGDPIIPVFEAEIFDPVAGTWTIQPPSDTSQDRMYHSTAMLLRDGRVVSTGGDLVPTAQFFKPPCITDGAPRPQIVAAPTYMQYGEQYSITYTSSAPVTHACLIRLASVTHGFDHDQRRVPLTVTDNSGPLVPTILIDAPANGNLAPPGYYMLFILYEYARNKYVPCEMAAYVQIGP